jgi:gliding motility-associated-like protein
MKKIIYLIFLISSLISISGYAQNDDCSNAQSLGTLPTPAGCPSGLGAAVTVSGTIVGATPSNPYVYQNGCSGAGGPNMAVPANDVWYTFVSSGYEAIITVTSTFANPNVAMYAGTCASLGGGVGGCAVGTGGTVTLTVQQMTVGTTFYLQVSGGAGQSGTFNLSVKNNKGCSDCINSTSFSASPLPVNGMYTPGQTVHFCYHINSYAEINTNWLHGVQISFGSGWNAASLVASPVTAYSCGTWAYYPTGIGNVNGTNWGPGFYFDRSCAPLGGGSANDGIPKNSYGDHITPNSAGNQNIYTIPNNIWNFCFDLTVAAGCNPGSNLSVTINTSGDGESGPWTSAGCSGDPQTAFNAVGSCCPPTMTSTKTCTGLSNGTATATPIGAGPFTYSWAPGGQTTQTATGLAAGTYTVTVTNTPLLCAVTNTVTVVANPLPVSNAGADISLCSNVTGSIGAASTAGLTYSWSPTTDLSSGTASNPTVTTTNAGTTTTTTTYTVTTTNTTTTCTSTDQVIVSIKPIPTVTVPANVVVCNTGNVAATNFLSNIAGTTFAWTNSNTAIGIGASGAGNIPSFTATNTGAVAITATITVTPTANGCPGTPASYTITVNPSPVVTVNSPMICPTQTATLTASGATSYTWSAGATSTGVNTATASPSSTTTYTVTGTTSGCLSTAVATVTIGGTISISVNTPTICNGQTATLTATGASTYSWNTGSTANPYSVSPTSTTSYTVTGTLGGCSGTATTTITVNQLPTMTTPANIAICNNAAVPASAFTSSPAGATFDWTNSNTTIGIPASGTGNIPSFTALNSTIAAITATITVTPTLTCVGAPVSYTITVNPTPTLVITDPAAVCAPGTVDITTAAVTAGSTAGTLSYWTNGAATSALASPSSIATTGIYYIKTTTAAGCIDIKPVNVTISPSPVLTITNPAAVCAPGTVDITAAAITAGSTGSGTLTYWTDAAASFGLASPNAVATSGTYYIQSAVGTCKDIKPVTVTINPKPTLVITDPAAVCAPGTVDITAAAVTAGSTAGTLTYWTDVSATSSLTSPNAVATTGTYYIKTTTAAGCTDIKPVNVTINPKPTLVISDPAAVCAPGTVDITVATVTAGSTAGTLTYWTDAGATSSLASPNAIGTSGTYYIKVTTAAGCTDVKPVTVTISPTPVLTITNPAGVCSPTTIDITAAAITAGSTGGGTLTYWTDPGATNPLASPNSVSNSATYYIVSTVGSCKDSKPVTVIINATPVLSITDPAAVCSPGTIDITAAAVTAGSTGGGTLTYWTNSGATSSLASPNAVATSGTYYIKTTTAAGCFDVKPVIVTINPLPVLAITDPSAVCSPGTVDITTPAVTAGSTGGGTLTYWTDNTATTALASPTMVGASGTYYIKSTTAAGCTDIKSVNVTINPKPALVITNPPAVCAPGTIDITAANVTSGSLGGGVLSYWTDATASSALASPNAVATSGTYYIKTTTASGCTDIQGVLVTINPLPVLVITNPNPVCQGNTVNITAPAVTSGSTGLGSLSYWTDAAATATLTSPNALTTSGTYYIKTTTAAGCVDVKPVTIVINPKPNPAITSGPTSGCDPLCVNFADASTVSSGSITGWSWNFGDASSTAPGLGQTPSHCFTAGTYTVTITDTTAAGCFATSTIPYVITVYPNPVASFSAPLATSILSPTVQYSDESTIAAPGVITTWHWDFGDMLARADSISTLQNPSHTFSDVGTYCADLIVTSNKGCKDTFNYCIVIDPEFTFFIPNAFSPNDDGINDDFYGKGDFIKTYEMIIYDRWGNMIFYTDDINKHWNGKANNGAEVAQQDVYVYVVKLTDNKDKKHKYIGTVTIVK